jgi:hypothetical protein
MTNTKLLRSRMRRKSQVRFWSRVGRSDLLGLGNRSNKKSAVSELFILHILKKY